MTHHPLERGWIERQPDGLIITIPSETRLLLSIGVSVWAIFLTIVCAHMLLLPEKPSWVVAGSAALLVFGLGGGGYVALWNLFGREIVELHGDLLTIRRRMLGMTVRTRHYDLHRARALRVDEEPSVGLINAGAKGMMSKTGQVWGIDDGTVVFEYDGNTVRLGIRLSVADGREIIELLSAESSAAAEAVRNHEPLSYKAKVIERQQGLMLIFPAARSLATTLYSVFVAFVALVIGAAVASGQGKLIQDAWIQLAVLAFLTVCGVAALYTVVKNYYQSVSVTVEPAELIIERGIGQFTSEQHYRVTPETRLWIESSDQRFVAMKPKPGTVGMNVGDNVGAIVFLDANGDEHRFGEGISPLEAIALVERMWAKAPTLRQ